MRQNNEIQRERSCPHPVHAARIGEEEAWETPLGFTTSFQTRGFIRSI